MIMTLYLFELDFDRILSFCRTKQRIDIFMIREERFDVNEENENEKNEMEVL